MSLRVAILLLVLGGVVHADPPPGYPWLIYGDLYSPAPVSAAATKPTPVRIVLTWVDDQYAYMCMSLTGDYVMIIVDGSEFVFYCEGNEGAGLSFPYNAWEGARFSTESTPNHVLMVTSVDYGSGWNAQQCVQHFMTGFLLGFLLEGFARGVGWFWSSLTEAVRGI